ncbi:MAG: peptide chain release factor N(5)-glutamine methyltransferase [Planctomycetia bacterium]|nr:peptide chain release factor N(5)-glutamine methyltransferase [Planctomycetia bacterium]
MEKLLGWTTQFLKERGAESPRLDAEVLLAHSRGSKRIDLYTSFAEVPPDDVRTRFRELVRRRAEGMPVAYLVGHREFYSMSFRVTPDVLIPRPETELLLVRLLDLMRAGAPAAGGAAVRVADVGTGSGVLAVCAARHFAACRVTAVDISPKALAVARENAAAHGVAERVEFVEGNLLASLPAEATFDFIVSNPPYVSEGEWATLAREVRDFEPRGALVAGPRGTEVIARLISAAAERLVPGGWLLTEISPMIEADVRSLVEADARFSPAPTVKDLAGLARVVQARRK